MSAANTVRRLVSLKDSARRRWLDLMEKVQEIGDAPFAVAREAETELNAAGRREVALGRQAVRAAIAFARERGIEYSSEHPFAIATPGGLLVVRFDDELEEPTLVQVPAERVVRLA